MKLCVMNTNRKFQLGDFVVVTDNIAKADFSDWPSVDTVVAQLVDASTIDMGKIGKVVATAPTTADVAFSYHGGVATCTYPSECLHKIDSFANPRYSIALRKLWASLNAAMYEYKNPAEATRLASDIDTLSMFMGDDKIKDPLMLQSPDRILTAASRLMFHSTSIPTCFAHVIDFVDSDEWNKIKSSGKIPVIASLGIDPSNDEALKSALPHCKLS